MSSITQPLLQAAIVAAIYKYMTYYSFIKFLVLLKTSLAEYGTLQKTMF